MSHDFGLQKTNAATTPAHSGGMLGLGNYDSDEDGEEVTQEASAPYPPNTKESAKNNHVSAPPKTILSDIPGQEDSTSEMKAVHSTSKSEGKKRAASPTSLEPEVDQAAPVEEEALLGKDGRPLSPYSTNRLLVQQLTMPPYPNLDIPPSPPGSPPPKSTKLFAKFLKLKKDGHHFNKRLANTASIRNPNLLKRQMEFVGMSEEEQYANAMPDNIVPTKFPVWAHWEELSKSQESIKKNREAQRAQTQRDAIEFVTASATTSERNVQSRGTTAESVRSGLNRDNPATVSTSSSGKDRGLEKRGSRFDQQYRPKK